jgi:hypothetical protein
MGQPSLREALVGAWELVRFETREGDGRVRLPFGAAAQGLLVYSATGWMTGQLMRPDRAPVNGNSITQATDAQLRAIATGYVAYAGPFQVDESRQAVIHHVQLSLFPNLVGTQQVRYARLEGDVMELRTPPEQSGAGSRVSHLQWRRIPS